MDFHRALLNGSYKIRIQGEKTEFGDLVKREFAESGTWNGEGDADLDILIQASLISGQFKDTVALGGGVYYSSDPEALIFTTRNKGQQHFRDQDVRMVLHGDIIAGSKFQLHVQPTTGNERYLNRVLRALLKGTTSTQLNSDVSTFMSRLVEPLIYLSLPHKSMTLMHASAVERGGKAILVFGVRDVGKTTTAMMLARQGYSLLSDDLCVVNSDGAVGAFLKPLKVEGPLLMADPESRGNLSSLPFSERFLWNAARWGRQRNPKYLFLRVLPSELLPKIHTAETASLSHVFFLENRTNRKDTVTAMSREESVEMALAHLDIEFEALLRHQEYLHSLTMTLGLDVRAIVRDHFDKIRAILESAFANATSRTLTLTPGDAHDFAASTIGEIVDADR